MLDDTRGKSGPIVAPEAARRNEVSAAPAVTIFGAMQHALPAGPASAGRGWPGIEA